MAKLRPDLPVVSVNLLQQTPSDRLLGDVLLANAAVWRLIEFKRAGKLTRKERRKLSVLRNGVSNNNLELDLSPLSREIHWYIEIEEPKVLGKPLVSRACPYLDFDDDPEFISIQDFAVQAAHEACEEEVDPETRRIRDAYLRWVCKEFATIEKEDAVAQGGRRVKAKTSIATTTLMVAINEKAETYWWPFRASSMHLCKRKGLPKGLNSALNPRGKDIARG